LHLGRTGIGGMRFERFDQFLLAFKRDGHPEPASFFTPSDQEERRLLAHPSPRRKIFSFRLIFISQKV
jgi:hypothetical protein